MLGHYMARTLEDAGDILALVVARGLYRASLAPAGVVQVDPRRNPGILQVVVDIDDVSDIYATHSQLQGVIWHIARHLRMAGGLVWRVVCRVSGVASPAFFSASIPFVGDTFRTRGATVRG